MATTIDEFRKRLGILASTGQIDKAMKPPMRLALRLAKKEIRRSLKATPLGAALWKGSKASRSGKPRLSVGKSTVARGSSGLEAKFSLKGVAAMIDKGGKIDSHKIRPRGATELAFPGSGSFSGNVVRVREVNHPGAIVRRENIVAPILRRGVRDLERDSAKALDGLTRRVLGR